MTALGRGIVARPPDLLRAGVIAIVGCLAVACAEEAPPPSVPPVGAPAAVRDSAGTSVIEHAGLPEGVPEWRIAEAPTVRIGAAEGGGPEAFGGLTQALELDDGTIVALDGQALEVRAFAPSGEHLWTSGGRGGGPGELASVPALMELGGDSVLIADRVAARAHVLDAEGRLARSFALRAVRPGWRVPALVGALADGTLVGVSTDPASVSTGPGWHTPALRLGLLGPEGEPGRELGTFPGPRTHVRRPFVMTAPLGAETRFAVGDEIVAAGTQDRMTISSFGADGARASLLRVETPVRLADRDRYLATGLDESLDPRSRGVAIRQREEVEGDLVSPFLPAFDALLVDGADRLWVQEYVPGYVDLPAPWWVFASGGEVVAKVTAPPGFVLLQVAENHVIGIARDSLGIGYVEVRPLVRDPS